MVALSPRVHRLRANNPSPMTFEGTNGYVIDGGHGLWMAVDPGPADDDHVASFVTAARAARAHYVAILITHGHPDHYPAAAPLARATGAPVYAGPHAHFAHDRMLAEGERLTFGTAALRILETPGHARDHLAFYLEDERALFTGDVILGEGTVVIAPPGGDMRTYQRTLARLLDDYGDANAIYGGHGSEVREPRAKIASYIGHRIAREAEILAVLKSAGPQVIPQLVTTIYRDVDRRLWPAAGRQILAYLEALQREDRIDAHPAGREATPEERAMLDPDLSKIANAELAAVVRAELGFSDDPKPLMMYALAA